MKMRVTMLVTAASAALLAPFGWAGPFPSFSDPAGQVQPSEIQGWANTVVDYSPAPGVSAGNDVAANALGPNGGETVSLGDLDETQIQTGVAPGSITVSFAGTIFDGPGPDFAVFENAGNFFSDPDIFAELAFVEVSTNGSEFVRFPSTSENTESELVTPFGRSFAGIDTTNVNNLAGYHPANIGTPFDLADLASLPEVTSGSVDLSQINFVRMVDIPGNGSFLDSLGNPILDAWVTTGSGGFDLDAVGTINGVPEPGTISLAVLSTSALLFARRSKRG